MSRLDDALAEAEARQTERDEIAAGDPLGYTIPPSTSADRAEAHADAAAIHRGDPPAPKSIRGYVKPRAQRHPDSEADPWSIHVPDFGDGDSGRQRYYPFRNRT